MLNFMKVIYFSGTEICCQYLIKIKILFFGSKNNLQRFIRASTLGMIMNKFTILRFIVERSLRTNLVVYGRVGKIIIRVNFTYASVLLVWIRNVRLLIWQRKIKIKIKKNKQPYPTWMSHTIRVRYTRMAIFFFAIWVTLTLMTIYLFIFNFF